MQTNILWTGRAYYSLENCQVNEHENSAEITSTIIGSYEGKLYKVEYQIRTNARWQTVLLELTSQVNNKPQTIKLEGDEKGNWIYNGKEAAQFRNCIDVDIAVTPFTNTLPIRRLQLQQGQSQEIQVIYCDILNQVIKPVSQKYTRLSNNEYHYENIPNDFEATIKVDDSGLVIDYPGLFVRTAAVTG
ncbi:putative glycolipid-binding domain-containing protein [Niastella sp. OAS944]|uniref:putative glycolipid-binding domain-containing protein n=1 Tax=Niastella sp. OAS944 TaxID=2664089 RepID=UPI00348DD72A|nr:hypothetical protein [Chitinophagaceae bacterium OAS944]